MNLISKGFELTVSLMDTGGKTTSKSFNLRATNYDNARRDSDVIVERLDAITACVVVTYIISEVIRNKDSSFPEGYVRNSNRAQINCTASPANKKISIEIPAPESDIFLGKQGSSARIVDVRNEKVIAYTDIFREDGLAYLQKAKYSLIRVNSGKWVSKKSSG